MSILIQSDFSTIDEYEEKKRSEPLLISIRILLDDLIIIRIIQCKHICIIFHSIENKQDDFHCFK